MIESALKSSNLIVLSSNEAEVVVELVWERRQPKGPKNDIFEETSPDREDNTRLNCGILPVVLVQINGTIRRVRVSHISRDKKQILEPIPIEVCKLITRDVDRGDRRVGTEDSSLEKMRNQRKVK